MIFDHILDPESKLFPDITIQDHDKNNVFYRAIMQRDQDKAIKLLFYNNFSEFAYRNQHGDNGIMLAVKYSQLEIIKNLCVKGDNIHVNNSNNDNLLHIACRKTDNGDVVGYLLN